ncbi:helix-turn-helix domain-containing protein [Pedobacter sp. MC2016-24]|uniref:helix-turn-helix domain-containing protein n=1 Tax=Pedobacter sp. MC2016-24 TaxID=2780090 RepID=UPI00187F81AF|nr:helix-turn-helix domain-containing protein [Pedobacter sp. MC2016-24]MBE9601869.1 helix-turn-helix domain-containing protein [Pedobacter sp. MC2016-24]
MLLKILNILQEILRVQLEISADLKILLPVRNQEEDLLLDNSDAKRMLKVGDSTLYRWRKLQLIESRRIGKKDYYLKVDLERMLHDKMNKGR